MKKVYMKPTMKVVTMQHQTTILAGSPKAYNETSSKDSYSRQGSNWDDDE